MSDDLQCGAWQQRALTSLRFRRSIHFWAQQWNGGSPEPLTCEDFPFSLPRREVPTLRIAISSGQNLEGLSGVLKEVAAEQASEMRDLVLAALVSVLYAVTQRTEVGIWIDCPSRLSELNGSLFGPLATSHVLAIDLIGADTGQELVRRILAGSREAASHQGIPLELVWRVLGRSFEPLEAGVSFGYLETPDRSQLADDCRARGWPLLHTGGRYAIEFRAYADGGSLWIWSTYLTDRFPPDRVEQLVTAWGRVLRSWADGGLHGSAALAAEASA